MADPTHPQTAAPDALRAPGRETASVVIPTYNVADILPRCLDALTWADEVVIVDMFSEDDTVAVAERYPNVRAFRRRDYIFGNANFGMDQARGDWIVKIDSDEVLDEELQQSIQRVLRNPEPGVIGYRFPSIQYMFGLPMHHGVGRPDLNAYLCMFRRGAARHAVKSEHEPLTLLQKGEIRTLDGHYEHYTNHDVDDFVRKVLYYADRDLEREGGEALRPPRPMRLLYRAVRMFVLYYWQWKGYRDGLLGFFSSVYRGPIYLFLQEAKRWEAWRRAQEADAERIVGESGSASS